MSILIELLKSIKHEFVEASARINADHAANNVDSAIRSVEALQRENANLVTQCSLDQEENLRLKQQLIEVRDYNLGLATEVQELKSEIETAKNAIQHNNEMMLKTAKEEIELMDCGFTDEAYSSIECTIRILTKAVK